MSELSDLFHDLTELADILPTEVKASIKQASFDVRDEWRKLAKGNPLGKQYTDSIDFTQHEYGAFGQGVYESEIGPDLARYGGKTGKGGLMPSAGFYDDPEKTPIGVKPVRARRRAEIFAETALAKRIDIAVQRSHAGRKL
ncbi:MAG: hypothetical protein WBA87_15670 [Microbacterium sp.]